ncbi:death-associated inhibitor of apoptosis 1-like [Octopus vulgaris]|uniref:Death-associated inhibitor of apoptosis 1-like n=3 Tax=Octopus TaxID=6643 RepID=A0AA36BGR6_OCTVU|nr:death-associated inhibitor of apoptosis 1-like [Octopus vulgaris]
MIILSSFIDTADVGESSMNKNGNDIPHPHWLAENRLTTFQNWTNKHVSKERIAEAGFIYTGGDSKVKCVFCYLIIDEWNEGDDPFEKHQELNAFCPFLKIQAKKTASENNIIVHKPYFPQYSSKGSRELTFETWPRGQYPPPKLLIDSGFFYTGKGDKVQCFHCSLIAGRWDPNDDVNIEHCRLSKDCVFMKLLMGPDYVQKCQPGTTATEEVSATHLTRNGIIIRTLQQQGYPQVFIDYAYFKLKMDGIEREYANAEELFCFIHTLPGAEEAASERMSNPTVKSPHETNFVKLCKVCLNMEGKFIAHPCEHFNCCVYCKEKFKVCPSCMADVTF